jgi:hypothetical protein
MIRRLLAIIASGAFAFDPGPPLGARDQAESLRQDWERVGEDMRRVIARNRNIDPRRFVRATNRRLQGKPIDDTDTRA